ncbi:hypothetical protein SDC9_90372 [bioreactor metagenome]|uniref:Uncharacterized protein n=1 Tax=bioreactor metagenome TaxID=1076179 RepID=A0A644ZS38_9ZZZZ
MSAVALLHRRHAAQICPDGVRILARDLRIAGVGERRIQQSPILGPPVVHGAPELGGAPLPHARGGMRGEIGRENDAERRLDGPPARKRSAARHGMAGHAVADARQILAARHQRGRHLHRFRHFKWLLAQPIQIRHGRTARNRQQRQRADKAKGTALHFAASTAPQRSGMGVASAATGLPPLGTGWAASQADTALTSSGRSCLATVAMQSGDSACRLPDCQAPICPFR